MSSLWIDVDNYFEETLVRSDGALTAALQASSDAGLPPISVAPNQGKLLHLLARIRGARTILEIGTLGGYSTIWLARALPANGELVSLELDPRHAEVAQENIARAGLSDLVSIRVGRALDTLAELEEESKVFDFIFIDADKENNPKYLEWSLKLSRPGTVIVVDNVVRKGAVVEQGGSDPNVAGIRHLFDLIAEHPRISATAVQTVGAKGYDGFALVVVSD
jgi:predicted O-methyltransferase YrrM